MKIKCKKYYKIYEDCRSLKVFHEGKEYEVSEKLGAKLLKEEVAEKIAEKKQDKREKEDKSLLGRLTGRK